MPYLIAQIAAILALAAVLFFALGAWFGRGKRAQSQDTASHDVEVSEAQVEAVADEKVLAELQMVRKQFASATSRIGDLEDELNRARTGAEQDEVAGETEAAAKELEAPSPAAAGEDDELGVVYAVRPGNADDLTEIRGIGKPLSKKLNAFGIYRFEQIAGWNDDQLAAVCDRMALGNRSQAAKWIEQAKRLAP